VHCGEECLRKAMGWHSVSDRAQIVGTFIAIFVRLTAGNCEPREAK
jgi:hypothetical protein